MLDKVGIQILRKDIDAALAAVGARHGLKITTGNCRYGSEYATFKLDVATVTQEGNVLNKEAVALKRYYPSYVNREVDMGGTKYKVVEYHSRKQKYKFIVENATGHRYKLTENQLRTRLV